MYILLLFLWIVFNGRITVELMIMGAIICGALYWFMCKFMGFSIEEDKRFHSKLLIFLQFILILVMEIGKSNMAVIRFLTSSKHDMSPVIVTFKTDLKTDFARVLLANCITLTPGTYTVTLEGDEYTVHALDKSMAEDIDESIFVKQLRKLEA